MGGIVLITGGSRSGKSAFAQRLAESFPGPRVFIATCPVVDEELRARIGRHQADRAGRGWETLEEQTDLAHALRRARQAQVVLVDCLTLWVNNLMYEAQQQDGEVTEDELASRCRDVLAAFEGGVPRTEFVSGPRDIPANEEARTDKQPPVRCTRTLIFVSNEVGMGIVPESAVCRRYRDLAGRCNQLVAAAAGTVALIVCGLPLVLKGQLPVAAMGCGGLPALSQRRQDAALQEKEPTCKS